MEKSVPIKLNKDPLKLYNGQNKIYNYDLPVTKATIENNGNTVQITPKDDVERCIEVKYSRYFLTEIHFHWGSKDAPGSEHVLDGMRYDLEAQFVHRDERDETAIVSVLFEKTSSEYNGGFKSVYEVLPQIHFRDYSTELRSPLDLEVLIHHEWTSYYHYMGSLTVPECDEDVSWFILKDINYIQRKHVRIFYLFYN
ncbi:carbonic anhydrase 15 [Trichonephila inaurata madagascariensis]|uniref:carbonic anhydrase n=1 Tax=Trichonephila inaurata madagascariensis TaxID=2747483 RepID=A0A8X6XCW8_9ARAC|nr:carbonic anhydrase 15 [Trichonephila inaurata madagascariensis]